MQATSIVPETDKCQYMFGRKILAVLCWLWERYAGKVPGCFGFEALPAVMAVVSNEAC